MIRVSLPAQRRDRGAMYWLLQVAGARREARNLRSRKPRNLGLGTLRNDGGDHSARMANTCFCPLPHSARCDRLSAPAKSALPCPYFAVGEPDSRILAPGDKRSAQYDRICGAMAMDLIERPEHAVNLDGCASRCAQPAVAGEQDAVLRRLSQGPGGAVIEPERRILTFKGDRAIDECAAQPDHA